MISPRHGVVGIEVRLIWLVLRWGSPLVVIGGSHRGLIRDRAPPDSCERLLTRGGKRRWGLPQGLGSGLSGWALWKSVVRDGSKMSSALTQDRSFGPYPSQFTRYWSTLPRRRESRTSWIRYTSSPSMMMGGAPPAGLSKDTWKVGEIWQFAGNANRNETAVICLRILKGPTYLGLSFLQGSRRHWSRVDSQTHWPGW